MAFSEKSEQLVKDLIQAEYENACEQAKKEFKKPTYTDYIKQDIEILILCDEIYMLRGWWRSKGARLEHHIAKVLGLKIIYQKRGGK